MNLRDLTGMKVGCHSQLVARFEDCETNGVIVLFWNFWRVNPRSAKMFSHLVLVSCPESYDFAVTLITVWGSTFFPLAWVSPKSESKKRDR